MATIRTPINRPNAQRLSAEAVRLFRAMQDIECTCEEIDWKGKYWDHSECAGCDEWWRLHSLLHKELGAMLWEWPCIQHPDAVTCFPEGSPAAKAWKPDRKAQARWLELEAAHGRPALGALGDSTDDLE
jgi:hypothetical protein